jgi:hypothetical protein
MKSILLFLLFAFTTPIVSAATPPLVRKNLPQAKGNSSIELPVGWTAVAELYGLPWVILGPDHTTNTPNLTENDSARRTAIAVVPTGQTKVAIDPASAEKSQTALFESRKKEIEKAHGAVLETIPYSHETWKGNSQKDTLDVHRLGLKFRQGNQTLTEISYHIVCNQKIFMIKSMISAEDATHDKIPTEKIVRSFQCE